MKKLLLLLIPALAIANNPSIPEPLPTRYGSVTPEPQGVEVIGGAIIVGGALVVAGWGMFKIADAIMDLWEHRITNAPAGPMLQIYKTPEDQVFLRASRGILEHSLSVDGPWDMIARLEEESFVVNIQPGFYRVSQ